MGAITILILALAVFVLAVMAAAFFNLYANWKGACEGVQDQLKTVNDRLSLAESERDELLRQKMRLTPQAIKEQDNSKGLSSAQARKRVNAMNASYFSAEKHVPNSEIAKENSNG